jgi:hypothetical protein
MAALITVEHARRQLRIAPDDDTFDDELLPLVEQATAIVIDYIKRPDHGWSASYDPAGGSPYDADFVIVTAAIAEVMTNLFRHRGDSDVAGPLTARVKFMLERLRDPALA